MAEKKKSNFELQAQLSKGIFDLFSSAFLLAGDSLKKLFDDEVRIFLNHKRFYYAAISFIKMKESCLEQFAKTAEGYGKAIAYQGLACDSLNNAYKDIVRLIF